MTGLTVEDLKTVQAKLGDDYRMELVNGEIVVMSPSGYESDEVAMRMAGKLFSWVDERRLGRVTASSAGFTLPNSNTRAPDVSFVVAERLRRAPRSFAQLAPDLMVEVKSPSDSIEALETKINDFLQQGTKVGILINLDNQLVKIFRSGEQPLELRNSEVLTVPDLLPGWSVQVSELWSPVFEDGLEY